MDLWISCNACHASFRAETHAGLLRCEACSERMAYRLPRAPRTVASMASSLAAGFGNVVVVPA